MPKYRLRSVFKSSCFFVRTYLILIRPKKYALVKEKKNQTVKIWEKFTKIWTKTRQYFYMNKYIASTLRTKIISGTSLYYVTVNYSVVVLPLLPNLTYGFLTHAVVVAITKYMMESRFLIFFSLSLPLLFHVRPTDRS